MSQQEQAGSVVRRRDDGTTRHRKGPKSCLTCTQGRKEHAAVTHVQCQCALSCSRAARATQVHLNEWTSE